MNIEYYFSNTHLNNHIESISSYYATSMYVLVASLFFTLYNTYYQFRSKYKNYYNNNNNLQQPTNGLIIASFKDIPIKIVSNEKALKLVVDELISYNPLYLGIDCEWRPNIKGQLQSNKVSIIQIAHQKIIILIRLNKIKNVDHAFISSGLLSIFSNVNIYKCGVGVYHDKKKLFNDYNINLLSCIELNHLYSKYNTTKDQDSANFMGLKSLSKIVLNVDMKYKFDDKSVTCSDWATDGDLTDKQIIYAAEDAHVAYNMFDKLIKQNVSRDDEINDQVLDDICFGIVDLNKSIINGHKNKKHNNAKRKNKRNGTSSYDQTSSSSLLYDNCQILKPNGEFLSWCRKKTLERYINKGYATRVNENSVKLKFEPESFNKKPTIEVVLGFKKNECAVCGESRRKLMRYFVVPLLYRQYLPTKFNEEAWRRHDMLPLCGSCHFQAQIISEKFKNELCKKYNVPHYRALDKDLVKDSRIMRSIKPLIDHKIIKNIPNAKKIILLKNVAKHFELKYEIIEMRDNGDNYDENDLLYFRNLIKFANDERNEEFINKMKVFYDEYTTKRVNVGKAASETHSKSIIAAFENNIIEFIKLWRKQFVNKMHPKFLPDYWSIDNTFFDLQK